MRIKVKSFATMRRYTARLQPAGVLELPEGARVKEVLDQLEVPPEQPLIILVNGRPAEASRILTEDDLMAFFPPLEGG
jgi:sulfur carrier protein ThiS